ncbi:MAG TPA: SLC13 family permease [Acidimicrobiia bacterium]|nr:SLC13 family permease [Acidimicrobiia bacterium]
MTDATIVYLVLAVAVALFVWNRFPVEIVAVGASLSLVATGVITVQQGFAGFGDTTVVFIAALFIVSEGIDSTGVTTAAGQWMVAKAGESRSRLIVLMMIMVAVLTAVISVNGAVAALLPMVVVVAVRTAVPSSRLLMPLAFGAHAGSLLALTGTPIHILVSAAAVDAGAEGFAYFEFALVGVPVVLGAIAVVLALGRRLVPDREPERIPPDLSGHARTLVNQYAPSQWRARLELDPESPLIRTPVSDLLSDDYPNLSIVEVQDKVGWVEMSAPMPAGAVITVLGPPQQINDFAFEHGLRRLPCALSGSSPLMDREVGVVEVVIPPRSEIIGEHVFPGMVTSSGDFVILAVHRQGEDLGLDAIRLNVGDTMLMQGTWDALDRGLMDSPDVLLVDQPSEVRRQAVPMGPGSTRSLVILAGMVVLLATGLVPAVVAAVLAAGALILTRVVNVKQAYRSISWTTVILVGGMIPVSVAVEESGAAEDIAKLLVDVVGDAGPYALLLGIFVITAVFGQLISNTATALIMIPIAITAATDLGISVRPVMMSLSVAAAAAFLTPVATAANLMVMEPAGYRFSDYWKLGGVMLLLFMAASVLLVPVFWSF